MNKNRTAASEPINSGIAVAEPVTSDDLAEALHAIAQAAQAQAASAAQIMQLMQQMGQAMQRVQAAGQGTGDAAAPPATQINIWEEDPFSEEAPTRDPSLAATISVPVPVNNNPLLQTRIT